MIIRKFRAPTLADALEEVRAAFGPDAVVLHTRRGGDGPIWRRRSWVEVTAAPVPGGAVRPAAPAPSRLDVADADAGELEALRRAAVTTDAGRPREAAAYRPEDAEPAQGRGAVPAGALRAANWSPPVVARPEPAAAVRPHPVRPAGAHEVRPAEAHPVREADVIALMGPSGAGKTTAAARLAAGAVASGRPARLATAGAFRPGATAQLRALARSFGANVEEVASPGALRAWLQAQTGACLSVVDFGAVNWRDPVAWDEFAAWAGVLPPTARRLLVVPAGWSGRDAEDCMAAFRGLGVREVALAKCDETAEPEAAASLARTAGLTVAFRLASPAVTAELAPAARMLTGAAAGGV